MIIGIALFALEIRLPAVIDSCVSGFGDMISPASMMVIGMVIGDVDLRWVFRQKRPYDLYDSADPVPVNCGNCFCGTGADRVTSGCGVYSDDRTDRNCSPGSSNGHTACTDLWKRFQIRQCDQCNVRNMLYHYDAFDGPDLWDVDWIIKNKIRQKKSFASMCNAYSCEAFYIDNLSIL